MYSPCAGGGQRRAGTSDADGVFAVIRLSAVAPSLLVQDGGSVSSGTVIVYSGRSSGEGRTATAALIGLPSDGVPDQAAPADDAQSRAVKRMTPVGIVSPSWSVTTSRYVSPNSRRSADRPSSERAS